MALTWIGLTRFCSLVLVTAALVLVGGPPEVRPGPTHVSRLALGSSHISPKRDYTGPWRAPRIVHAFAVRAGRADVGASSRCAVRREQLPQ